MANLGENFDPNQHQPVTAYELLESGVYNVCITESEVTQTRKGTGTVLKLVLTVTEGKYQGRKLFWNINLTNTNPKCQEIGKGQLSAVCKAVGLNYMINDSNALHDRIFPVEVAYVPEGRDSNTGEFIKERNEVKGVKNLNSTQGVARKPQNTDMFSQPNQPPQQPQPYPNQPPPQQNYNQPPVNNYPQQTAPQQPMYNQGQQNPTQQPYNQHQPQTNNYQPPVNTQQPTQPQQPSNSGTAPAPWANK